MDTKDTIDAIVEEVRKTLLEKYGRTPLGHMLNQQDYILHQGSYGQFLLKRPDSIVRGDETKRLAAIFDPKTCILATFYLPEEIADAQSRHTELYRREDVVARLVNPNRT